MTVKLTRRSPTLLADALPHVASSRQQPTKPPVEALGSPRQFGVLGGGGEGAEAEQSGLLKVQGGAGAATNLLHE